MLQSHRTLINYKYLLSIGKNFGCVRPKPFMAYECYKILLGNAGKLSWWWRQLFSKTLAFDSTLMQLISQENFTAHIWLLCLGMAFLLCVITASVAAVPIVSCSSEGMLPGWVSSNDKRKFEYLHITKCCTRFTSCRTWLNLCKSIECICMNPMWSVTVLGGWKKL